MSQILTLFLLPTLDEAAIEALLPRDALSIWKAQPRHQLPSSDGGVQALLHGGLWPPNQEFSGHKMLEIGPDRAFIAEAWQRCRADMSVFALSGLTSTDSGRIPLLLHDFATPTRFDSLKALVGAMEIAWLLESIAEGEQNFSVRIDSGQA